MFISELNNYQHVAYHDLRGCQHNKLPVLHEEGQRQLHLHARLQLNLSI